MGSPLVLRASLLLVFLAAAVPAQLNRHSVTQSYDAASPEVTPTSWATSDVMCCRTTGAPGLVWARGVFGLPAGADIDAISDGTDVFPPSGPIGPVPPVNGCRLLAIEFSVDRASVGHPASIVSTEVGGNGAAGDVFRSLPPFIPPTVAKAAEGMCTSPNPEQSNISDLAWVEKTRYPVYFSIAPILAGPQMMIGAQSVAPADVLVKPSANAPIAFHMQGANIGLQAADDIDAIAVNSLGHVVFSLTRSSPTGHTVLNSAINSAGLWIALAPAGGSFGGWASAANLGLTPTFGGGPGPDELDGVRITDPALFSDGLTSWGTGTPGSLRMAGDEGSTPHRVRVPGGVPIPVDFLAGLPAPLGYVVFGRLGIPTNAVAPGCPEDSWSLASFPPLTGSLSFAPPGFAAGLWSEFVFADYGVGWPFGGFLFSSTASPWTIPGVIPAGWAISLQGVVVDTSAAPFGLRVSNMVTLIVE